MKLQPLILLASAFALFPLHARALDIESAISEGVQNSPGIQGASAKAEQSRWKKSESLGEGFLPKITVAGERYFKTKYEFTTVVFTGVPASFPGMYPTNQLAVSATLPIFDGFSSLHRFQAASLEDEAAQADLDYARFELSERIRLAFYRALSATLLRDVSDQNVKTLEDHLRQVTALRSGGAATRYDSLRVEVQLSEARSDLIDAEDDVRLARRQLALLMGLDSDERPLEGELPVPRSDLAELAKSLDALDPSSRADLHALALRSEAAGKSQSAQSTWLVPSVSLAGQYLLYNNMLYNGQVVSNNAYSSAYDLGVFVTWNLFDGGVSYSKSRESDAQAIQAEKSAQAARIQAPYDFEFWKKRFLSNSDRYLAKKLDVNRSEESVRLSKEEHKAGTRTSTEVLDAELDLFRSKAGLVNAQVNAAEALIRLELALGRSTSVQEMRQNIRNIR